MFFTVSPVPDPRLPYHERLGTLIFSHDEGWLNTEDTWQKGYQDTDRGGNWCCLSARDTEITLEHGQYRSFPLWWDRDKHKLTNLLGTGERIWADQKVRIHGRDLYLEQCDPIGDLPIRFINKEQACDMICDRLIMRSQNLLERLHHYPKKIFLTGGVDTLTLYCLMQRLSIDVELLDYEYIKYDWFLNHNLEAIKQNHWGYQQIHHWQDPTVLITGGCGDEFMFRGPVTISLWAAWHDIDLESLLSKSKGYHVAYFSKPKNLSLFRDQWNKRHDLRNLYPTSEDLLRQILNINVNDHQHWHLGNTLTWTPFLDLELTKIVLSLGLDDIVRQIIDADISRAVILSLDAEHSHLLSNSKNVQMRQNL